MGIIRIAKDNDPQKYFQSFVECGLFDRSRSEYKKWHWKYVENPACLSQNLPIWVYIDDKTVGHLGAIPIELKVLSRKVSAAWAVDFVTLAEYRKKGIGRALAEEVGNQFDLLLTVGQTDMSFNLFRKMGWRLLGCVPYYIKIWDTKTFIKERIKNNHMVNGIASFANLLLKFFNYFKNPRKVPDIESSMIDNFNSESDSFWEKISGCYRIAVPRNYAYLHWKYDRQPDMHYVKFRVARKNKVCGYIILRCINSDLDSPDGIITDILVHPEDKKAIEALFFVALRYLRDKHCSVVRCYVNNKYIQRYILNFGFIKCKPFMRFLVSKKIDNSEEILNLDNWYLSAGDCDIDR